MSINNDYTTGNLLNFSYHQNCYKLIGIDLSRQKIRAILNKLILQKNQEKMMAQQCVLLLKISKKLF